MVLLKGNSEAPAEQPAYEGKLPGAFVNIEIEASVDVVVNGDEGEHVTVRSKRELPAGFVQLTLQMVGSDPIEIIVNGASLSGALIDVLASARAKDREA
jgi:hypothetical protein